MTIWEELNIPVEQSGRCGESCTWAMNASAGVLVISGIGPMHTPWKEESFPDYHDDYDYYNVSPWGSEHGSSMLHRLIIEEGVTAVDHDAFAFCTGLQSVRLPSTLERIEGKAFAGCSALQEIILPDSLQVLGKDWAYGCQSLRHVHLGAQTKLPEDDNGVFPFCRALTEITVSTDNPDYIWQDGMLFGRDEKGAFSRLLRCSAAAETVHVPDTVRTIEKDAFFDCAKLTELHIPASVQTLPGRITVRNEKLTVYVVRGSEADRQRTIFTEIKNKVKYESGLFGFLHQ